MQIFETTQKISGLLQEFLPRNNKYSIFTGPRIHLQVRSGEDIVISDEEVMPSVELIQGYRELKRAAEAENNEH